VVVILHDGQLPLGLLRSMKLVRFMTWAHTGHEGYGELELASAQGGAAAGIDSVSWSVTSSDVLHRLRSCFGDRQASP